MKKIGLYIHIPFCKSKCAYCNFTSFKCGDATISRYLDALKREIRMVLRADYVIDTIYIGGGTPSILRHEDVAEIVECIKSIAVFEPREFTIECNPESVTEDKVKAYKDVGINRISMGVQSLNDDVLRLIGRLHTSDEAIAKAKLIKSYGFNLSVDMILGLPHSVDGDIERFIETFSGIGVDHISAYSLSIEKGTRLYKMASNGEVTIPSDDDAIAEYDRAYNLLNAKGYHRYEVSNFAKQNKESQHNNKYWLMDEYVGLGVASHSFINNRRYYNTNSIDEYVSLINSGKLPSTLDEELMLRDRVEETLMLALRLERGVELSMLDRLVGGSFVEMDSKNIDVVRDYIIIDGGYLRIKPEYMNVMNTIIVDLLS